MPTNRKLSFEVLFWRSLVKILFVEILLLKIISVEDLKFFSGLLGSNGNFLTLSMKSFRRCSSRTFLSIRCLDSAANQEITAEYYSVNSTQWIVSRGCMRVGDSRQLLVFFNLVRNLSKVQRAGLGGRVKASDYL